MTSRTVAVVLAGMALLIAGGLIYLTNLHGSLQHDLADTQERRVESILLADELRQSSDDLTRMARAYVVTGDPHFETYFWEILAIRNGEAPLPVDYESIYWDFRAAGFGKAQDEFLEPASLSDRMADAGFSDYEFLLLAEAETRSNALVRLEEIAMNAVKGQFQAPDGSFTESGAPDLELARELMFGSDYFTAKAHIMEPINDFLHSVRDRTTRDVAALEAEIARTERLLSGAVVGIALLAFGWLIALLFAPPTVGPEPAPPGVDT